jgi:chemotaxis protein CheX
MKTEDNGTARAVLETLLVRSALEVLETSTLRFEESGTSTTSATTLDDDGSRPSFAANIGFVGDQLRGCLVVVTTAHVVQSMQPEDLRPFAESEEAVRDLLGELANLMLGRLKNQLLKRGAVVLLATPTTMSGRDLRISSTEASPWHVITCSEGTVMIRLEADLSECGPLVEVSSSEAEPPMDEGEMMLF